jgi:DNA/RNA-binding domain of Phe-tRNA-synthetase-like protein
MIYAVDLRAESRELWEYYENNTAVSLRQRLAATELAAMPHIGEARAAYKAFGLDPGRHRISSEALYRRIRQGKALYQINPLVDVNNIVSLETGFSLGSYDTSRIGPDIVFRLGQDGESYPGIGKASVPLRNMPLLSDGGGPFGSPTSDSTRGMTTPDTKEGLTVIYSFSGGEALASALEQAERQFIAFAGITAVQSCIVD